MTEHPLDDLAAFALGALDEPDRRAVDEHVRGCESCAAEVESYRGALHAYAASAEASAPDLRASIVTRARRDNAWTSWLRRPVPALVPIALVVLLVASLVGYVGARQEADAYAAALASIPGGRVVTLQPSAAASDLRGALVVPESGTPYLLLRVPVPPAGRAWEAWVLRGSTPIPAGLAAEGGLVKIVLTSSLASGDGVAVTLEPASGSSAPTSTPVLIVPRT